MLEVVEVPTQATPRWAVIWLHGLGADGHDFEPVVPELRLPAGCAVKFLFPHAPLRPVTVNGGMVMRAWYDLLAMGPRREVNENHLDQARDAVFALMDRLNGEGIPDARIVLVGFSQGGAVAYHTALNPERRVAGLACLSTYRIGAARAAPAGDVELPVFVAHGEWDPVVSPELGREAFESLVGQGMRPVWHDYPMEHQVCIEELRDLGQWLQLRVGLA